MTLAEILDGPITERGPRDTHPMTRNALNAGWHPMGIARALDVLDLRAVADRRRHAATLYGGAVLRPVIKAQARRMIVAMREVRLSIGADGYKLP